MQPLDMVLKAVADGVAFVRPGCRLDGAPFLLPHQQYPSGLITVRVSITTRIGCINSISRACSRLTDNRG